MRANIEFLTFSDNLPFEFRHAIAHRPITSLFHARPFLMSDRYQLFPAVTTARASHALLLASQYRRR